MPLRIENVRLIQASSSSFFRDKAGNQLERFTQCPQDITFHDTQYVDWEREKEELRVEFRDAVVCEIYLGGSRMFCGPKKGFEPDPDYETKYHLPWDV